MLDTDVLNAANAQCCITNFCGYYQLWFHPPSQCPFYPCVSGWDMPAAVSTLLIMNFSTPLKGNHFTGEVKFAISSILLSVLNLASHVLLL